MAENYSMLTDIPGENISSLYSPVQRKFQEEFSTAKLVDLLDNGWKH